MRKIISSLAIIVFVFAVYSCSLSKNTEGNKNDDLKRTHSNAGLPAIIYKTRKDYFDKVPVILNEEKTAIVSFPGPKDVLLNGKPAYPSRLVNGFLLDNRGINVDVAFLDITYADYAKRVQPPSMDELMKMIIDKNPLEEMYECGSRFQYKHLTQELNDLIREDKLNTFVKLY